MVFDFLKSRESESPPDVGREEEYERSLRRTSGKKDSGKMKELERKDEELNIEGEKLTSQMSSRGISSENPTVSNEIARFEFEKINARIEAMNALMKGFNERFSNFSQQIGEIRAMTLANEKSISKTDQDALRAVDIVKEVQPDKLRMDFQRLDLKINSIDEKLIANRQYAESLMEGFKEIKRKAGIFEGGEAILRLGEDIKKDMVELQKMSAKVRMNVDKSEQIFIETRKGASENSRLNEIINNLDLNYSGIKNEIEKLKIDYSKIVRLEEFNEFQKNIWKKFALAEKAFSDLENIKGENERIGNFAEKILAIEKKNEEDIADIGISIGSDRIKKVSDFNDRLNALLEIVEEISAQVGNIKKKIGYNESSLKDLRNPSVKNNAEEKDAKKYAEEKPENPISEKIPLEKTPEVENIPLKSLEKTEIPSDEIIKPKEIIISKPTEHNLLEKSFVKKPDKNIRMNLRIKFEKEMNDLLLEGGRYLVSGNFENAFKVYEEIRLLYNPEYDNKKIIYYKIMRFYENLFKLGKSAPITFQKTEN